MKHLRLLACSLAFTSVLTTAASAQIEGLDTNGSLFQVAQRSGAFTPGVSNPFTSYSLGGTTRKANTFYYVAVPSGGTENALFSVQLKTGVTSQVDLDRNDSVRALFFNGKSLFGVFYDGNAGTAGVYKIQPTTGVTTLVLDLSTLDVEPIAGAFTRNEKTFFMLVKPEIDATRRQLLSFRLRAGSAKLVEIADASALPVTCDKLEINAARKDFVCLASAAAETQVNFCRLSAAGRATCLNTLPGILRVGGGHTLLTLDRARYYAFVYVPGEPDNQRLIKISGRGVIQSNVSIPAISIGAHFASDLPPAN